MMILDKFKLDTKVAVITGASRGLGQAMAVGLAEAGAKIALVARGELTETASKIKSAGSECVEIDADLAKIKSADHIILKTIEAFGKIDILINNAGIIRRTPLTEFTMQDWDDVMDVNLRTLFYLSQQAAKQMIAQGNGGKIINIASLLSYQGGILVPSYTASKSAVLGLTRLMANELAPYNINVNGIAPGYMATDNTKDIRDNEQRNKAILERIPAGRWGTPDDLKGLVVFLASAASDYINGFTIAADGGWLAR